MLTDSFALRAAKTSFGSKISGTEVELEQRSLMLMRTQRTAFGAAPIALRRPEKRDRINEKMLSKTWLLVGFFGK